MTDSSDTDAGERRAWQRPLWRPGVAGAGAGAAGALAPLVECAWTGDTRVGDALALLVVVAVMVAGAGGAIAVVRAQLSARTAARCRLRWFGGGFAAMTLALGLAAGWAGGAGVAQAVRLDIYERAIEAARPLVAAIRAFEREHGAPPEGLADLVPSRLAEIPEPGFAGKRFELSRDGADGSWQLAVEFRGWPLEVHRLVLDSAERYRPGATRLRAWALVTRD